jgi:ATP-dependent Clp protease ATP-binding subunit ClpA
MRVTVTGPANEPRQVLVEIPKEGERKLTLEDGAITGTEETATAWRVPIALKPGEVRRLTAYIDRLEREQTAILADDAQVVVRLLNEQTLTPEARMALLRLAALRQDEAARRATMDQLKTEQAVVLQDEERIRRNLAAVPVNDALHTRLARALDADESKLERLSQAIEQATAAADKARHALADAAGSLRL